MPSLYQARSEGVLMLQEFKYWVLDLLFACIALVSIVCWSIRLLGTSSC